MSKLKDNWQKFLSQPIFFVTPDVIKGVGLENKLPNYHIVSSFASPLINSLRKKGANIFCLEEIIGVSAQKINNSAKLLSHSKALEYIRTHTADSAYIMFFKPSLKIGMICKRYGFLPIGNQVSKNIEFEDKINFYHLTKKYFPKHHIPGLIDILGRVKISDIIGKFGLPFVIQFARSWSGKHVYFINYREQFLRLKEKFPHSKIRVSKQILGTTLLNNCCISRSYIFVGPPAIQLSGISALHPNKAVTCGRQWPAGNISGNQIKIIEDISQNMGQLMRNKGYKGFYGLDFIVEEKTGRVYLSENNARLTASASFYTKLELASGNIPLIAYHIACHLGKEIPFDGKYSPDISGSQITFRLPKSIPKLDKNFGVYRYKNKQVSFVKKDYNVEDLSKYEFIFIKTLRDLPEGNAQGFGELARIETKRSVLSSSGKLKKWVKKILQIDRLYEKI